MSLGGENWRMASTCFMMGRILSAEKWCPKNVVSETPNSHLSMFTVNRPPAISQEQDANDAGGYWDLCWQSGIIQIDECERKISTDCVHQSLESVGSISKAEGHLQKLKEAKWCNKSCRRNVIWVQRNLIISLHQIQLGEYSTARQPSWKLGDVWYLSGVVALLSLR